MFTSTASRARRWGRALAAAIFVTAAAGYFLWPRDTEKIALDSRPGRARVSTTPEGTEERWMAAEIGRRISELIAFAATGKDAESAGVKFTAERIVNAERFRFAAAAMGGPETRAELTLTDYFWSPENFLPWSKQLLSQWRSSFGNQRSAIDRELFDRLLTPSPDTLIGEDQRISQALTRNPLDAELHEQAALLLGSFALREGAQEFCDPRREMCAITAHLAIARTIDVTPGPAGKLAEALLCILSGRETPAAELIAQFEKEAATNGIASATATAWVRALQTRNTFDYRILEHTENATLLERLELFRALRASVSTAAAQSYLQTSSPEHLAEWPTVILAGPFTVADGNRWAQSALAANLEEAAAEYRSYFGKTLEESGCTQALNASSGHFVAKWESQPRYEVLGWNAWAGFRQRQLCNVINGNWYWLKELLGLSEEAEKFRQEIVTRFSGLKLSPLLKLADMGGNSQTRWAESARKLCLDHPELLPFDYWTQAHANFRSWFTPMLPLGTVFDLGYRSPSGALAGLTAPELEKLKALAPHNLLVREQYVNNVSHHHPTASQFRDELGPVTYQRAALWRIAEAAKDEPDIYEPVFAQLCELDPDYFVNLGDYLVQHGQPEAAAAAYQNAVDRAPDRVRVSNDCRWLADYYYDHDRRDDARAIAQQAADVYSSAGLKTAAHIMERDGHLDEAEKFLQQQNERYNKPTELAAFYARQQESNPRFANEYHRYLGKIFPAGMKKLEGARLAGAPQDGVKLTSTSAKTTALGLKVGDVIVAVNGTGIANMQQYYFLIDSTPDPHISFTAWNGRSYVTADAELADHRLGVNLDPLRR